MKIGKEKFQLKRRSFQTCTHIHTLYIYIYRCHAYTSNTERERQRVRESRGSMAEVGTELARQHAAGNPPLPILRAPRRREERRVSRMVFSRGEGVEWNGMESTVAQRWGRGRGGGCKGVRRLITQFQDCHYLRPLPRNSASIFFASLSLPSPSPSARVLEMLTP